MIGEWRAFLLERGSEWGLPAAGDWKCLFHNNYHFHHSNINLLWFHDADPFPRVVTKIFRQPEIPTREFENLKRAYGLAPACVPRPLHYGLHGECWTLWMEGVPGSRFWDFTPASLDPVVETLALLHGALRNGGGHPDPNRHSRMVCEPLRVLSQFGTTVSVRDGCAQVGASATAAWIESQAVIPQHGDIYVDNVVLSRRKCYFVDWESFGEIDLPFYDLITLLVSRLRGDGETPEQWSRSLVKHVPFLLRSYAQRLGLAVADVRLLLPLTLANWFALQWSDGRREFAHRMYKTIEHYFEHTELWEGAFL